MPTNDCENVTSMDAGFTNKFYQIGEFTHMEYVNNSDWLYTLTFIVLTLEDPFEYICIMFSAPCFTLSSISNCFCKAINLLLLVEQRGSLLGVSGVLGQSVN